MEIQKSLLFETGDIETFKEHFCFVIKNNKTKEKTVFVINNYENNLKTLLDFIEQRRNNYKWFMFSYNGNKFDWIVINYLIKHQKELLSKKPLEVVKVIYYLNKRIQQYRDDLYISELKSYLYNHPFFSIDLMCFWTISTIKQKKLSLKFFEISMDLDVEECPIEWEKENLTQEECNSITFYCEKDVDATISLAERLKDKINSRFDVIKAYPALIGCLSWDDVKIGYETLLIDIAKENNVDVKLLPSKTHHNYVNISDVILPEIQFDSPKTGNIWMEKPKSKKKGENTLITCFDNFTDMLEYLKKQTVQNTTSLNLRVTHKGVIHDVKSGGLHSYHDAELRERKKGFLFKDIDVSSYYPTLGVEQNFVPEHLKLYNLNNILKKNKDERIRDKLEGRKGQAEIKKLKLNGGFFGN